MPNVYDNLDTQLQQTNADLTNLTSTFTTQQINRHDFINKQNELKQSILLIKLLKQIILTDALSDNPKYQDSDTLEAITNINKRKISIDINNNSIMLI